MRGNDGLRQFGNIHFLPLDRAIGQFAVIVEKLFDQLLQIAAAVIKDLNDFLLFRRQRPRYPVRQQLRTFTHAGERCFQFM